MQLTALCVGSGFPPSLPVILDACSEPTAVKLDAVGPFTVFSLGTVRFHGLLLLWKALKETSERLYLSGTNGRQAGDILECCDTLCVCDLLRLACGECDFKQSTTVEHPTLHYPLSPTGGSHVAACHNR